MLFIGKVIRLQVQRSSLKTNSHTGDRIERRYDPSSLLSAERLDIDSNGVTGIFASNARVIDVHNRRHIESKNIPKKNDVSLGFTSHYESMRRRFGAHITDGIAGENIIIETMALFDQGVLGSRLVFVADGRNCLQLENPSPAEPCEPFSKWALHDPSLQSADPIIGQTLKFLRNGMRGYYSSCRENGRVEVGNDVFAD